MASAQPKRQIVLIAGLTVVLLSIASTVALLSLRGVIKRRIISTFQGRFNSDVQIGDLQVAVFPHIYASAKGITLRINGRTDIPPLIIIQKFALSASLLGLLRGHVSEVHLEGLQIHVPPRHPVFSELRHPGKSIHFPLVIDRIVSDDALLETLPNDAKHVPRDFQIYHLILDSFAFDRPASFHATLSNPQPLGDIDTHGQFGPWQGEDPGYTAVTGTFQYSHADFSTIHGLSGVMSSAGKFSGTLDHLDVEGDTQMPDFALLIAGNPMRLDTHYVAVVDGTNGNTYLKSVDARLGNSWIHVSGEIVGIPGVNGRHILLDAGSNGRAEDLVGLAVKGGSPIIGSISLHTKIDVLPTVGGTKNALQGTSLDGQFGIAEGRFANPAVQGDLNSLSRRGRGQPENEDIQNVVSNLRGHFVIGGGTANLSNLVLDVPGAGVQLNGCYDMKTGDIDFHGHLLLDAKVSQTVTGAKSILLKVFDPFFKRDGGGSSIPIQITGNRWHPKFGLDLHPARHRNAAQTVR